MRSEQKLDFLQALRGVSILLVVLSHTRYFFYSTPYEGVAKAWLQPGAAGVDVFFVISGFIMAYTTRGNDGSTAGVARFFVRRFTKIWIPYVFIGLAAFAVERGAAMFSAEGMVWIAKSLLFIPPDVREYLYMGGGLTAVAWSLNFEAYFYVVFGLSMLFARFRYPAFFVWCLIFLVAYPLWDRGSFSLEVASRVDSGSAYLQLMTNPIIFEFLAGVLIGQVYCSKFRIRQPLLAGALALAGVAAFVLSLMEEGGDNGLLHWGAGAVALVFSLAMASKTIELPRSAVLTWFGTISYSLYLIHSLTNKILVDAFKALAIEPLIHTLGFALLTLAVSTLAGAAAHKVLDEHLHVRIREWLLRRRFLSQPQQPSAPAAIRS